LIHAQHLGRAVSKLTKSVEMDLSAADGNDYLHSDRGLQFKRERRKVGKPYFILIIIFICPEINAKSSM